MYGANTHNRTGSPSVKDGKTVLQKDKRSPQSSNFMIRNTLIDKAKKIDENTFISSLNSQDFQGNAMKKGKTAPSSSSNMNT